MLSTAFDVKSTIIPTDHGQLEAEIFEPTPSGHSWLLMSHPHPLYGGSMHQPLVVLTCRIALDYGFTSVRFNFRGVGRSTGTFSGGIGELQDLHQVYRFFTEQGAQFTVIGGYSFGAWVSYEWLERHPDVPAAWLGIAPPNRILPFEPPRTHRSRYILYGQRDPFIDSGQFHTLFRHHPIEIMTVKNTDHFFSNQRSAFEKHVRHFFKKLTFKS